MMWKAVQVADPTKKIDMDATPYGFVVDYLWAVNSQPGEQGTNVARLPHWAEGRFIVVDELDPDDPGRGCPLLPHAHDIFVFVNYGNRFKYEPSMADMESSRWQVSTVEWEPVA